MAKFQSIQLSGQSIKDALVEYTILDIMNNNQFEGIEFDYAEDGFPAYKFLPIADVKSPYRLFLPEKLYEFAIMASFSPNSPKGGYLFSVVNPLDTVVQLGLHLSPAIKGMWNVSLLYTQSESNTIRKLVSYHLPYKGKTWSNIAFQVLSDKVVFYHNCKETETTLISKEPMELVFDSASTLYVGQAGPNLGGNFE
ncbi:collagen alpha-1(XVIII) chain-like, partial [Teleopsis dalmanni]